MGSKHVRTKSLTVGQQVLSMEKHFPKFQLSWNRGVALWIGDLQPAPASETYTIKVRYALDSVPGVWVTSPELIDRPDGAKIPHVYEGKRLCLYLPGSGEWERTMFIAETIIPWASLWLYHYEVWHATGEWLGGGVHPTIRRSAGKKQRRRFA